LVDEGGGIGRMSGAGNGRLKFRQIECEDQVSESQLYQVGNSLVTAFKRRCFEYLSCLALAFSVFVANPVFAQDSVDLLLDRLRAIQANQNPSAVELKSATIIINRIVQNFPASNAAVSILLEETYEGIDFKYFEQRLAATLNAPAVQPQVTPLTSGQVATHVTCIASSYAPQAGAAMQLRLSTDVSGFLTGLPELLAPETTNPQIRIDYLGLAYAIENCAPYANWPNPAKHVLDLTSIGALSVSSQPDVPAVTAALAGNAVSVPEASFSRASPNFGITSAETESLLELDRPAVRDLQARLLVLGFDPNGVDGSLGKGARSALSSWQSSIGVEPTGFLNLPQLGNLKEISQDQLSTWLQEADNATLYNPPQKARKKKRRVRVCKRNAIGVLYDCKYRWR
jgi:hypothetical protein